MWGVVGRWGFHWGCGIGKGERGGREGSPFVCLDGSGMVIGVVLGEMVGGFGWVGNGGKGGFILIRCMGRIGREREGRRWR